MFGKWCERQPHSDDSNEILAREHSLLTDSDYLVTHVIGKAEFDWDFRCLGEGFMDLASPYVAQSSGVAALFDSSLDALDAYSGNNPAAVLFVEFGHYATLINDFYTFHPLFLQDEVPPRDASQLTQLRYAGQFLNNYPRYLLVQDRFGLSDERQIQLHETLAGITVSMGMARGTLLNWLTAGIGEVSIDKYLQNAVCSIENYVAVPVLTALILADADSATVRQARRALQFLCLAMKLQIERDALVSGASFGGPSRVTETIFALPGFAIASSIFELDGRSRALDDWYDACRMQPAEKKAMAVAQYDDTVATWLGRFRDEIRSIGALSEWGEHLATSLLVAREGSADA